MKALASTILCVWCCVMMTMIMVAMPSLARDETPAASLFNVSKQQAFPMVTFDLRNGVGAYSNFLTRLRNLLAGPNRPCGLPSTRRDPLAGREYVYARLQISNTQWVTLGIDARDIYVRGYQDNARYGPDGASRASFLSDAPSTSVDSLFPGVRHKRVTGIPGNYIRLEPRSGGRLQIPLGLISLDNFIRQVYQKSARELDSGNAEARFFMLAIQLVSEAARFRTIENGIKEEINRNPPTRDDNFRLKMVTLENNWDSISSAIHRSEATRPIKCGAFNPPLQVGIFEYPSVDAIRNEMGIVKY